MKILRVLAFAGAVGMMFPAVSLASAKEQKKKVAIEDPVEVAGKTLKPGQYQVKWAGNGPTVHVSFLKDGKTLLTAPAQVAQLRQKAPYDAVVENTKRNGKKSISEIEWNNQREALRFGKTASGLHNKRGS